MPKFTETLTPQNINVTGKLSMFIFNMWELGKHKKVMKYGGM